MIPLLRLAVFECFTLFLSLKPPPPQRSIPRWLLVCGHLDALADLEISLLSFATLSLRLLPSGRLHTAGVRSSPRLGRLPLWPAPARLARTRSRSGGTADGLLARPAAQGLRAGEPVAAAGNGGWCWFLLLVVLVVLVVVVRTRSMCLV